MLKVGFEGRKREVGFIDSIYKRGIRTVKWRICGSWVLSFIW